jgi:hypothetical protein
MHEADRDVGLLLADQLAGGQHSAEDLGSGAVPAWVSERELDPAHRRAHRIEGSRIGGIEAGDRHLMPSARDFVGDCQQYPLGAATRRRQ